MFIFHLQNVCTTNFLMRMAVKDRGKNIGNILATWKKHTDVFSEFAFKTYISSRFWASIRVSYLLWRWHVRIGKTLKRLDVFWAKIDPQKRSFLAVRATSEWQIRSHTKGVDALRAHLVNLRYAARILQAGFVWSIVQPYHHWSSQTALQWGIQMLENTQPQTSRKDDAFLIPNCNMPLQAQGRPVIQKGANNVFITLSIASCHRVVNVRPFRTILMESFVLRVFFKIRTEALLSELLLLRIHHTKLVVSFWAVFAMNFSKACQLKPTNATF